MDPRTILDAGHEFASREMEGGDLSVEESDELSSTDEEEDEGSNGKGTGTGSSIFVKRGQQVFSF